ncbi:MAG TPA: PAS domain S-box protein, partial [Rhizobiaceae bacterium]|nr:PAS domain S-box protein [Rhizobiaceae bacterium]
MLQQLARQIRPAGLERASPVRIGRDRQGPAAAAFGLAAIVILLALLAAAMFFADRAAKEERRVGMITDALWVEQALRFATRSTEDVLIRLAADIRMGEPMVAASVQIEQIMRLRPELVRVALLDADGVALLSLPGPDERQPSEILRQSPVDAALRTGERLFSNAYLQPVGAARFDLVIPAYAPGSRPVVLVASFSLSELLNAHIPWWVAQKNHVEIRDTSNTAIAAKSRIDIGLGEDGHTMPFDPPGHGLTFQVTPYDTGSGTALRPWVVLIVLFSGMAAASLFAMLRNIRRRQKAEEALRAESAFRTSLEDSLTVGMRARDHLGRIIYANQAFCDMVGFSREELAKASPPMPYWNPGDLTKTQEIHDEVLAGRAPAEGFEIRFQRRNGELFDALVFEAPLLDADGKSLGWMASIL